MFLILARAMLVLDALIFVMIGVTLARDPGSLDYFNIESATGYTAIRTWGGMFIGVGLVGLVAAMFRKCCTFGLVTLLIVSTMIVLTRLLGMAIDGVESKQLSELGDECLGPIFAMAGLVLVWFHNRRSKVPKVA